MSTAVIIGRANVGKSTLFNRLSGARYALISPVPGTTRDLKEKTVSWRGEKIRLIDTGGFLADEKNPLKKLSRKETKKIKARESEGIEWQVDNKARQAVDRADMIILLVDAKEGLNPQDRKIAINLKKLKDKKIIVAANKCDNETIRGQAAIFYRLGLGEPSAIAAASGAGIGDLLDRMIKYNQEKGEEVNEEKEEIKICLIGKPNTGKSSLLNALCGEQKAIVSPLPHTTREPNEAQINFQDKKIIIIDTAGIRKKAKIAKDDMENIGVDMSIKTLKKSEVALLIIDISTPLAKQDLHLGEIIAQTGVSVIIVANKYDLVNGNGTEEYKKYIYSHFPHLSYAPIIFISAKTGAGIGKIIPLTVGIRNKRLKMIEAEKLNEFLRQTLGKYAPPAVKNKKNKIKKQYIKSIDQKDNNPPTFRCRCTGHGRLPESYLNYITNEIRKNFDFEGTPIKIFVERND